MLVCPSNEQTWTDNKDPDRFPKNKMIDNYMESLRFFLLLVKAESSSTQLCLSKKITYPIPVIYHFFLSENKVSFGGHIGQTQFPTAAHIFHPPSR